MALQHMVWMKFGPEISQQRIDEHMEALRALQDKVPVVQYVAAGKSLVNRAGEYTHGALITLTGPDAMKEYEDHPEHVKVAKPLDAEAEIMAIDVDDGASE